MRISVVTPAYIESGAVSAHTSFAKGRDCHAVIESQSIGTAPELSSGGESQAQKNGTDFGEVRSRLQASDSSSGDVA